MNALGYCRISTAHQSEHSLDFQERMIRQYCQTNNINLLEVFTDNGESSYTFDRPDYNALEAFIKKNRNVKYLIVVDCDRLSRNLGEALLKISELQKKYQIKVLTVADPIDIDLTDPAVFMMRAFKFMQAEAELHNIRRRTKNGMIEVAMKGRYGHKAPYGYVNARDERDTPVILVQEDKADIVRLMFREYLSGLELEQVRALARQNGYHQQGKSAVRRILTNPVYCGLIEIPAHKGRKNKYAKGLHAPLVSEQDFWLAQERLEGRKRAVHNREEVPLKGVLHCWCGRRVTAGNSRSKTGAYHWYYLCQQHKANLPAKVLHRQFGELLDSLSIDADKLEWLRAEMETAIGEHLQKSGEETIRVKREIKFLESQIKLAERKYFLKPNISEATFNEVVSELRSDLSRLQRELAEVGTNVHAYWDRLNDVLPRLGDLKKVYDEMPIEKQHQFINAGFDNNLYYENGSYRTHRLHPLLAGNELILKQKKLLIIEQPIKNIAEIPCVPQTGASSNFITQFVNLLELIA